ncbi:DUF3617 domain-containing protein [Paraurantiacibacter namhicola]|uniref:DUF3617 domain-containing protein n=1 Tax=Paraurantiacibacter namhicola TaxID=645517 RepID=A0A1C7DB42_9SPHN|nr:DUF3617 domain-containing protein [Paraurantiacibacter namhicola]ANU08706.1 hypothetical protein A6F65_02425 [Paraurantiacibacter namhicola]
MKKTITLSAAALALTGCGGAAQSDSSLQPGKWQVGFVATSFDIPGATPEQEAMFEDMIGEGETQEQCLTPEEAERGFQPMAEAFSQAGQDSPCEVANFEAAGGQISGDMVCTIAGADEPLTSKISGIYDEAKFTIDIGMTMERPDFPEGSATMGMRVSGERLGDC